MLLKRLTNALKKEKVAFALAGGYAVNLHGAVRGTVDIDLVLVLTEKNLLAAEKALNGIGLVSRVPVTAQDVFRFRVEYIQKRNMIAWSFCNPNNPIELVDIVVTHDLAEMKKVTISVGSFTVPVLAREDLIAMKNISGRPQDIEDIKALRRLK